MRKVASVTVLAVVVRNIGEKTESGFINLNSSASDMLLRALLNITRISWNKLARYHHNEIFL